MKAMSMKFYITTPIFYVNDKPHIGHAYAVIATDALARYHRMIGDEVLFITGTDENSQKNVEAAEKLNEDVFDYVDRMSALWQLTWDELGISNNDFIRTTEDRHLKVVNKFWQAVADRGDIYKGTYNGLYCVGCEAFYTETDLVEGRCPIHQTTPKKIQEENYFFKLNKYRQPLLEYIKKHPEFIQPETRRHEVLNYIRDHLTDLSISRLSNKWGIPVPDDESQAIYVWFDALINYLTAVGYGTDDAMFQKWWPADLHVIGKDIIKFHCALWPAMLMSTGLPLPKQIFAHGYYTKGSQKIRKSLVNVIYPKDLVETYGLDAVRYFLLREIPFGSDGDFSIERLAARYDADLASGLGNLVSRVITLAAGRTSFAASTDLKADFAHCWVSYNLSLMNNQPHDALDAIWQAVKVCDQYIDKKEPWRLVKDDSLEPELLAVLGTLIESLRQIAWLLIPLLPETAAKIFTALGWPEEEKRALADAQKWGSQTTVPKVQKIVPLFPRLNSRKT